MAPKKKRASAAPEVPVAVSADADEDDEEDDEEVTCCFGVRSLIFVGWPGFVCLSHLMSGRECESSPFYAGARQFV